MNKLNQRKDRKSRKLTELELELKRVEHKTARAEKDVKDARATVDAIARANPWIEADKQFFGRAKTDFDFEARNPRQAKERLATIKDAQGRLAKTINKKVLTMFDKAEQEYRDLMNKKETVERDQQKITAAITELDEKKKEVLRSTHARVNRDFGSIFSTLLPGTNAKLEAPEGMEVFEGLQVRVAFGDTWKESLTELSGGQRSLLALSLILALLLFKPAPVYILDEVDAALDLSHTQNIGRMLKNHFKNSQFIVVSLKEGMFNNANVIFRTKFVNGQSTVTRIVGGAGAGEA
nr:structural maintenance of chromosomes protein SMC-2 [Seculamonas ecuadoriensis]